jgi:PPK2 family polyphosphate:nucleotide phosphotransferase
VFEPYDHPTRVPFDGAFRIENCSTHPGDDRLGGKQAKKKLKKEIKKIDDLQRQLYAQNEWALLLVFQAMDAAGKDSTIRAVTRGLNPAGFQVASFKQPSPEELDHDFLWRTAKRLPERGRIGIFNRSYYEEVLVVRVHPEYLGGQRLPSMLRDDEVWKRRYASIRDHESHLARNGTVVLKFWLNVSREEQTRRFVSRIDEPEKNWKFSSGDVAEAEHWPKYMEAYEEALNATSRPWAPWYAIPADDKPTMRWMVARIVRKTLEALPLAWPEVDEEERRKLKEMRDRLV